jgi:hypothetical protein
VGLLLAASPYHLRKQRRQKANDRGQGLLKGIGLQAAQMLCVYASRAEKNNV